MKGFLWVIGIFVVVVVLIILLGAKLYATAVVWVVITIASGLLWLLSAKTILQPAWLVSVQAMLQQPSARVLVILILLLSGISCLLSDLVREAEYAAELVCNNLTLTPSRDETEIASPHLSQLWLTVNDLQLRSPFLKMSDDPTIPPKDGHEGVLEVKSAVGAAPLLLTTVIKINSGQPITLSLRSRTDGNGARLPLSFRWDRSRAPFDDNLSIDAASLNRISLNAQYFNITLQHSTVTCGNYKKAVGAQAHTLYCQVIDMSENSQLSFASGPTSNAIIKPIFFPTDSPEARFLSLESFRRSYDVGDVTCDDIWYGRLNIADQDPFDFSKDFVAGSAVAVSGPAQLRTFQLMADGFHVRVKGKSSTVKVDGDSKVKSHLQILQKSPVILLIVGFVAWLIDKALSLMKP
jgi:hypothetical protein